MPQLPGSLAPPGLGLLCEWPPREEVPIRLAWSLERRCKGNGFGRSREQIPQGSVPAGRAFQGDLPSRPLRPQGRERQEQVTINVLVLNFNVASLLGFEGLDLPAYSGGAGSMVAGLFLNKNCKSI